MSLDYDRCCAICGHTAAQHGPQGCAERVTILAGEAMADCGCMVFCPLFDTNEQPAP